MPALPTGIITQITGGDQAKPRLKQAYLMAVDLEGFPDRPPWQDKADKIAFQYWPETVTDSRAVEWNPRSIPGGSHPIYQWTHSGERKISFTSVFTNDFEPEEEGHGGGGGIGGLIDSAVNAVQNAATTIGLAGAPPSPGEKRRAVDVAAAVSWLRWFTYPCYEQDDLRVFEPAKCQLVLPGSRIGFSGLDDITCVMTQCEVTYEAFFTNGAPRIVEVSLEFAEVVQSSTGVQFHSRDQMVPAGTVAEFLAIEEEGGGSGNLLEGVAGAVGGALGF